MFPYLRRDPTGSDYADTLSRSRDEIVMKTAFLQETFGLGTGGHWGADLATGIIAFETPDYLLSAPVQVVGTLCEIGHVWRWAWDDAAIPKALSAHAARVRDFGIEHGITHLIAGHIEATESEAWDHAAIALHINGATGAYRGPSDQGQVYMIFGDVAARKT